MTPNPVKISGQVIIDQIVRNMELGQLEMAYSILLPCIFNIYLHPDDYTRLASVEELLREDARRALSARLAQLNRRSGLLRRRAQSKQFRIALKDWNIQLFADSEGTVPAGDVEIHSELNEIPQPGFRGVKTTLIGREPTVREPAAHKTAERTFAEIRYEDDSGPQVFYMTQNEVSVGRGGEDFSVDLPLYTKEEVSREHLSLRRDAAGVFFITDKSMNGTWLDGRRLARGIEEPLPERASIGLAEAVILNFEARR